jgi:ABC-type lipoprotein release transport system permease subunit
MIRNYFKIAWRNLVKNKTYSLLNIGGLSLGMSVAFLIVYGSTMNMFGCLGP